MEITTQPSSLPTQCQYCHQADGFNINNRVCSRCTTIAPQLTAQNQDPFQNYFIHRSLPLEWVNAKSRSLRNIEKISHIFIGLLSCLFGAMVFIIIAAILNGILFWFPGFSNEFTRLFISSSLLNLGFFIGAQCFLRLSREQFISSLISISENILICFLASMIIGVIVELPYTYPLIDRILSGAWNGLWFAILFSPVIATLTFLINHLWHREMTI